MGFRSRRVRPTPAPGWQAGVGRAVSLARQSPHAPGYARQRQKAHSRTGARSCPWIVGPRRDRSRSSGREGSQAGAGGAHVPQRGRSLSRGQGAHTAAAARRTISAAFRWFMEEGWTTTNPVIGTRKPPQAKPREHVLTDAELAKVWKACGDDDFGRIVRLLILLGSRRQEIGGMRQSELDLEANTWMLPPERSKNHRGFTVALPPPALAIIKSVPQTSRDHLFGDRAGGGFTSWSRSKRELDRSLTGHVRPFRVHDIRRSVATGMADIGIEPHVIVACLNHYSGHRRGTAGVYNRSNYERAVKAALARWSEHVLALAEGRESNIV